MNGSKKKSKPQSPAPTKQNDVFESGRALGHEEAHFYESRNRLAALKLRFPPDGDRYEHRTLRDASLIEGEIQGLLAAAQSANANDTFDSVCKAHRHLLDRLEAVERIAEIVDISLAGKLPADD